MGVVFQEIPDEVTLSLNISACPCRCPGCHSQYLWEDIGKVVNEESLKALLDEYAADVTCFCFMGGDATPGEVDRMAAWVRENYHALKIGWYSGRQTLAEEIDLGNFNYIKLGPYIERRGGLNKESTNQRLYRVEPYVSDQDAAVLGLKVLNVREGYSMIDITNKFWRKYL